MPLVVGHLLEKGVNIICVMSNHQFAIRVAQAMKNTALTIPLPECLLLVLTFGFSCGILLIPIYFLLTEKLEIISVDCI